MYSPPSSKDLLRGERLHNTTTPFRISPTTFVKRTAPNNPHREAATVVDASNYFHFPERTISSFHISAPHAPRTTDRSKRLVKRNHEEEAMAGASVPLLTCASRFPFQTTRAKASLGKIEQHTRGHRNPLRTTVPRTKPGHQHHHP